MRPLNSKSFVTEYFLKKIDTLSFSSFLRTFKDVSKMSVLRSLMNQLIESLFLKGQVIDIGGGKKSNYMKLLNYDSYMSINIDPAIEPDILLKVNQNFPLDNDRFDTCILFNVLEHIFDWEFIFSEISRILRNQSEIHIIIPFLYPIHGAPNDYIRTTSEYLKNYLNEYNFKNIKVLPISYGPFTNAQLVGYNHILVNGILRQISVFLDKVFSIFFKKKLIKYAQKCPLFYYVHARLEK